MGDRVRLISRGGYDYIKRFPWIVEAARKTTPVHHSTARHCCSPSTAFPISTSWRWTVTISGSYHCRCASKSFKAEKVGIAFMLAGDTGASNTDPYAEGPTAAN